MSGLRLTDTTAYSLYGITLMQTFYYYRTFVRDRAILKFFVS
jgi:hypothetical protein